MKKQLLLLANIVAAVVLAYVFLSSVGLAGIWERISAARWEWLALGALLYAAMNLLNSFRIAWTLSVKWRSRLFFQHMTAMLVSDFTPGRAGYASLIQKLRVAGVNGGPATKSLGVLFIADFLARAVLAVAAVAYFGSTVRAEALYGAAVLLFALGLAGWWVLARKSRKLQSLFLALPVFGNRLAEAYGAALKLKVSRRFLAANVGLSLVGAFLRGTAWTAAFVAVGVAGLEVWPAAVLVSALVTVASFIPVSLAGVGVQEGLGAYLFSAALGIDLASAAAVMVTCRVMEFGTDALLGWRELLTGWTKA